MESHDQQAPDLSTARPVEVRLAGAKWWFLGFPLAVAYFGFLFRIHRGKVKAAADGKGY